MRLRDLGRDDLAEKVRWLADEGARPGYDILSFNSDGSERWVEVKATTTSKMDVVEIRERERMTNHPTRLTIPDSVRKCIAHFGRSVKLRMC